ncbi:hypothetical protein K8R78_03105 [bacterium]|nr:hypothetical protein [bacterium]
MKTLYALITALLVLMALSAFATSVLPDSFSLMAPAEEKVELKLSVDLGLKEDTLEIGKEEEVKLELTIVAETEAKVWEGECPSSLIYDFTITSAESREDGDTWRWSRDSGRMFATVVTPVVVEGSAKYTEVVNLSSKLFEKEGKYLLTATFVASGQSITQSFEVKFVK